MNQQIYFDFKTDTNLDIDSFFVNKTNSDAFLLINNKKFQGNIILIGPSKSGKSHLANIWLKNNNAIIYKENFDLIINQSKNVLIEDLFLNIDEEKIFHLVNHCTSNNLKLLLTTNMDIFEYNFKFPDLFSRLRIFNYAYIKNPDDEILINVLTKLLTEKQFIIKNNDIFEFLLKRINRTYEDVYKIVDKMNSMSLEKKRQLTIPTIRELI
tara:strand:+ start:183 stop:815 length:633 start_codon:yes stop_codon:yes gene_type:complete